MFPTLKLKGFGVVQEAINLEALYQASITTHRRRKLDRGAFYEALLIYGSIKRRSIADALEAIIISARNITNL